MHRKQQNTRSVFGIVLSSLVAWSSLWTAEAQDPVTLTTDDAYGITSFTNSLHWSDGLAPHEDADYLVSNWRTLRTPENSANYVFGGRSLSLSNGYVNLKGTGQISVGDLRLYSCRLANGINGISSIYATNTVYGTTSGYSRFSGSQDRITRLYGVLLGSGELSFDRTDGETSGSFYTELRGDNSAFTGGMRVLGPNIELRLYDTNSLGGALSSFRADALKLVNTGVVYAASSMTLDTHANRGITLSNGGAIRTTSGTELTLACPIAGSGGLTIKGDGRVILDYPFTYTGDTTVAGGTVCLNPAFSLSDTNVLVMKNGCRVLEGTGSVANAVMEGGVINPSAAGGIGTLTVSNLTFNGGGLKYDFAPGAAADFVRVTGVLSNALTTPIPMTLVAPVTNECPTYALLTAPNLDTFTADDFSLLRSYTSIPEGHLEIQNAEGTNTLVFVQTRTLIQLTASDPGQTSSFTSGTYWSDGAVPSDEKDYWVASYEMRSPESSSSTATFTGHSLTLSSGSLKIKNAGVTINDFRLIGGTLYQGGGTSSAYLAGTGTVYSSVSSPFNFECETSSSESALRHLILRSTLQGSGDLRFRYTSGNSYPRGGAFTLTGTNTEFTGGITVNGFQTIELRISDERNLGGDPASFRADQLKLESNGVLRATASLALDDPHRGITLGTVGGILWADTNRTLTVAEPITGSGALTLRGPGALVLSGTNTYSGGTVVESNALVEVRSAQALGSNAVSFAADTALRIPRDASALPLGVRLGGQTPLTVPNVLRVVPLFGENETLPKAFDLPLFLLTQSTTFDTSLVSPAETPSGYQADVKTRTVDDAGTSRTQVYIHYRWDGLVILVL